MATRRATSIIPTRRANSIIPRIVDVAAGVDTSGNKDDLVELVQEEERVEKWNNLKKSGLGLSFRNFMGFSKLMRVFERAYVIKKLGEG